MGEDAEITGFAYLPRQDGRHEKGVIGDYEFYVSPDGKDWGQGSPRAVSKRAPREIIAALVQERNLRCRRRGQCCPSGNSSALYASWRLMVSR